MNKSVAQSVGEYKDVLGGLDEVILQKALEWGKKLYQKVVEQLDELLFKLKLPGLGAEHKRPVWYSSCLGKVRVKRRQYWTSKGVYRYLLDEVLGMVGKDHMSAAAKRLALEMGTSMSFRRSAEVLAKASAVRLSHQTIWKLTGRVADPYLQKADREIRNLLETGELPEGEGKKAACLLLEADGVMLSLQRQRAKKAEVKLGIAYEGWTQVGKDRYATVNKTIYGDLCGTEEYWAGMTVKLAKSYDLAGLGRSVLGGDGASWVKEGCEHLGSIFQLDRYHLNRELRAALGADNAAIAAVRWCCEQGEIERACELVCEAAQRKKGEEAKKISRLSRYLRDNAPGLRDYRLDLGRWGAGLRRTGAMEGNVDKLVVRRMKNQGMSWSPQGIRRMLCVRFLYLEGKADEVLKCPRRADLPRIPARKVRSLIGRVGVLQPHIGVLETALPALYGPHRNRPWVQVLKSMLQPNDIR